MSPTSHVPHRLLRAGLAIAIAGGLALSGSPSVAAGHCCKEIAKVKLQPVDPAATPKLRGTAAILDCFGVVSMLDVTVSGPVPDGTAFAPAVVAAEPLLGDFFYTVRRGGEGYILDVTLPQVQGNTVSVFDQNFVEVLTGTF